MRSSGWELLAVPLLVVACGEASSAPGEALDDDAGLPRAALATSLRAAHDGGHGTYQNTEELLTLALDAVAFASAQTGQTTLTGRIRQVAPGATDLRFEPTTDGRLTVALFDEAGQAIEVVFGFATAEGQGSTPSEILGADHHLDLQVTRAAAFDLRLVSIRTGAQLSQRVVGTAVRDDATLELDLRFEGTRTGEVDSTGGAFVTRLTASGTVRGEGFEVAIDESFEAELVVSGRDSANASTSRLGHVIQLGDRIYRYEDVIVRRNFRDGVPSDVDGFWRAEGTVTGDGEAIGRYRLVPEVVDAARGIGFVVVELQVGETTLELERWQKTR